MMGIWLSASQLSELPGWPSTERRARDKAEREKIPSRSRQAKGGGKEYHISGLSLEAQSAARKKFFPHLTSMEETGGNPQKENGKFLGLESSIALIPTEIIVDSKVAVSVPQDLKSQQRIDAKLAILRALESFCKDENLKKLDCQCTFATRYNQRSIPLDDWIYQAVPSLSRATLCNFEKTIKTEGVNALGGKYGQHLKGKTKIDEHPAVRELAIAMLVDFPHIKATRILEFLQSRFEPEILPSIRTLERWMGRWKEENKEVFLAIKNPDGWKSKYMTAFGSYSENIKYPNQLWELDSTPADILLADGRYSILGAVDVYSRRAKLIVSKTSKATAIAALLRRCLLDWGVPDKVKTDRGADYTSNHIKRVFAGLNVEHLQCQPFSPWQKPHVERFFRSFSHDLLTLLPGFIGHKVADRKELESSKSFAERLMQRDEVVEVRMMASEFQKTCDRWLETYLHREHEGLGGKSPFQMLATSRAAIKRISNERTLDILLAEAPGSNGIRTVQKRGIQLEGAWFVAPELEACMGCAMQVLLDPMDMGRIYVFTSEGDLACIAECPERTGISRQEVAAKARELQKRRVQEGRRALKQISKKANTSEVVEEILSQREEAADRLVQFPSPTEEYSSDGLRVAEEVLRALEQPEQRQTFYTEEELAGVVLEDEQHDGVVRDEDYFCDLWGRLKTGKKVPPVELDWMLHYLKMPEGRGCLRFLEIEESDVLPYLITPVEQRRMAM